VPPNCSGRFLSCASVGNGYLPELETRAYAISFFYCLLLLMLLVVLAGFELIIAATLVARSKHNYHLTQARVK
jgi:hypothetical protein